MLVIAATRKELSFVEGAETFCCGIGPIEAALSTAGAIRDRCPDAILHIGIAGARAIEPGQLVLGRDAIYCDLPGQAGGPTRTHEVPDSRLLAAVSAALPGAHVLTIGTSARMGGAHDRAEVEAMEGFGVLRAAADAGVPAVELRAISNTFEADRSAWRIEDALAALARAVATVLESVRA
jgi:nucleoside phosphorylase